MRLRRATEEDLEECPRLRAGSHAAILASFIGCEGVGCWENNGTYPEFRLQRGSHSD